MYFLISCLFISLGGFVGSFGIIQLLIILFFAIPFTRKLKLNGIINNSSAIYKKYILSFIVLSIITAAITYLVIRFGYKYAHMYYIGIGFVIFIGIGQCGTTQNNVTEYYETNIKHINTSL